MKLILRLIGKHKSMFFTAVFFLCIETSADLMQPAFMSYLVDRGVKGLDIRTILIYGAAMLGIALLGAFGAVMRNVYSSRTSQQIGKELRSEIYRKVQTFSFENMDRVPASSVITRITNDVTQIQNFTNSSMRIMLKAPITCIGAIILIIVQAPAQIPVLIAILFVSGIFIAANMRFGYPRFGRLQKMLDKLNRVSREFISSIRVVKAFHAEGQEEEKFAEASQEYADAGISAMRVIAVFAPLINLTVNIGIIVMLWMSAYQSAGHIGKLMASVNYMTQVLFSLGMVSNILNMAVRALTSAGRVQEILDEEPAQKEMPGGSVKKEDSGCVEFCHVSFRYAKASVPALEDICFTVHEGETIGIIGATGSGKSTLVNLVPRFYDSSEGQVLIHGQDVRTFHIPDLRRKIAVVPQKALLFTGTIAGNLRWGDEHASDTELSEAARIACAAEFIHELPDKYDTMLGQGGVNLSGGQKQRLSIARALLRKPEILILDDCTSALDATTEARVLKGLRKEAAEMTVFLISQRISTVMGTDRILCIENGRVCGYGSHDRLMTKCREYRDIYQSQIGGGELG